MWSNMWSGGFFDHLGLRGKCLHRRRIKGLRSRYFPARRRSDPLPNQARYQLRYTRIFTFLHDTTENGKNKDFSVCGHLCGQSRFLCRFQQPGKVPRTQVSQGFAAFRPALSRIPPRHTQSKRATNCANSGYEIQTDPTAGCSNSGVCLQMATPQNPTAVHVACRKRTECRRKTILYFTEICRKVKSYIEEAPCPYGHGALILATAAAIAAAAAVAAAPTAAAAAAPDDDQQNDDPAAVPAASATVITAHIGTSYEIEM